MAQYFTRIHIKVTGSAVWKRLHTLQMDKYGIPFSAQDVFATKKYSLVLTELPLNESNLKDFITDIAKSIRGCGAVVADTTDINVDPYTYGLYSMSSKVQEFLFQDLDERCEMFRNADISDIAQWLTYGKFEIGPTEKKMLSAVNVRIKLPKKVKKAAVVETEEEKAARIEKEQEAFKFEGLQMMGVFSDENGIAIGDCDGVMMAYEYFGKAITLDIPNGVKGIFYKGFATLETVEEVVLPEGLETIDSGCFWGCEKLKIAHIPKTCKEIGEYAFLDCPLLTISAPAGSYAETYAKENNIPFVAE